MINLKKILVPTDFSECSGVALQYACSLADAFGASIHLFHVLEDPYVHGWTGEGYVPNLASFRDGMARDAAERIRKVLSAEDMVKYSVKTSSKFGSPFLEILRYAKEEEVDLIVMGTHGRGPVAHVLMGSVAERVVRKAPCPVLTVRQPGHVFVMP